MSRQVVICLNPHDICPTGSLRKEPELLLIYDNATFPGGSRGLAAHFPEGEEEELKTVVIFQLAGFQAAELSFFTQSRLHYCSSSF